MDFFTRERLRTGAVALGVGVAAAAGAAFLLRGTFLHWIAAEATQVYVGGAGVLLAVLAPLLGRLLRRTDLRRFGDFGLLLILFATPMTASMPLGRHLLERDVAEARSWSERLVVELDKDPDGPYPGREEIEARLGSPPRHARRYRIESDGRGGFIILSPEFIGLFPMVNRYRSSLKRWDRFDPF